jgi:hypothetical protein
MTTGPLKKAVRETWRSRPVHYLARGGFAVNGLVHALIGLGAIGVALGAGGRADQGGALRQIAQTPGGVIWLWLVTIGLAALGLWLIVGAFVLRSRDPKNRITYQVVEIGKGVAYLVLAAAALTSARGGQTNSEADVGAFTAMLIATPGGVFVLLLVAALVVVVGVYFVHKGVRRGFVDDIDLPKSKVGRTVVAVGIFGYVAKGVALAVVGVLLGVAAVKADSAQASGLDGSLRVLSHLPLGQVILVLIGLGFIAYGLYCFVRARLANL